MVRYSTIRSQRRKSKTSNANTVHKQVAQLANQIQSRKTCESPSVKSTGQATMVPRLNAPPELVELFSPESKERRKGRLTFEGPLRLVCGRSLLGEKWRDFYVVFDPPTRRIETFDPLTGRMVHSFLVGSARMGVGRPKIFDIFEKSAHNPQAFSCSSNEDARAWVDTINAACPGSIGDDKSQRSPEKETTPIVSHNLKEFMDKGKGADRKYSFEKNVLKRHVEALLREKAVLEVDNERQAERLSSKMRNIDLLHAEELQKGHKLHAEVANALADERKKHESEIDDITHELLLLKSEHSKALTNVTKLRMTVHIFRIVHKLVTSAFHRWRSHMERKKNTSSILNSILSRLMYKPLALAVRRWQIQSETHKCAKHIEENIGHAAIATVDEAWKLAFRDLKEQYIAQEKSILSTQAQHAAEQREIYISALDNMKADLDAARNETEKVCRNILESAELEWKKNTKEKESELVTHYESKIAQMKLDHEVTLRTVQAEHEKDMMDLKNELLSLHASELSSVRNSHELELAALDDRHITEKTRMNIEHSKRVKDISFGSSRLKMMHGDEIDTRSEIGITMEHLTNSTFDQNLERDASAAFNDILRQSFLHYSEEAPGVTSSIMKYTPQPLPQLQQEQEQQRQNRTKNFRCIPVINLDELATPKPRAFIQIVPKLAR